MFARRYVSRRIFFGPIVHQYDRVLRNSADIRSGNFGEFACYCKKELVIRVDQPEVVALLLILLFFAVNVNRFMCYKSSEATKSV